MIKLTLITINPFSIAGTEKAGRYNNASGLQKTRKSVLAQTSKDFEYIVVDGDAPLHPPKGGLLKNPHPLNTPKGDF